MRTHTSSAGMAALFGLVFLGAALASVPRSATAAIIKVTENTWGTTTTTGSFAWAIDQANTQSGLDTIRIDAGLEINVDSASGTAGDPSWLAQFTESANVQGNGAKLVGNPTYITTGGSIATKTNIVGNPYEPAILSSDVVTTPGFSFAKIGTSGTNNSLIEISFTDLGADGLASIANVYQGAQLSVSGGDFDNIVNYTTVDAAGRGVFEAYEGSTLNLTDISITRSYPFANAIDVNDEAALFFGTIQGADAQLNMENSSINNSYGAGAVAWTGGTANVVSSVINNAGGLEILDGTEQGVLNFVNSILYMTGGDDLSQTNRIQAVSGGEANITASSILYDALSTSALCDNVSYECNGMPLTALLDGVLNFDSSVAVPINASLAFPGKDSYREYTGGDLRADQYSFIGATEAQIASVVRAVFDNLDILTEGDTYDLQDFGDIQLFNDLPSGAFPLSGGVLASVIPNAGSGGVNALINPIDQQPILVDVYGQPRTYLALTYDGASLRLYENGIEVAARAVSGNLTTSAQALQIGGNTIWGDEHFAGRIDEVRVYDRALSAAELQVDMTRPVAPERVVQPTRSSPIVVDSASRLLWVVNPDNDSVAALGADSLQLELEIPVGAHPMSLAVDGLGMVWAVCQDDDSIWILDGATGAVAKTLALPWGSAPVGIVFGPDGDDGYVAAHGSGRIQRVDAPSRSLGATLDVGPTPRALAITGDGQRLLVTQFISGDSGGTVRAIDLASFALTETLDMPVDMASVDSSIAARGLPNYLAGIAIDPSNDSAWVVAKKDNILRGAFRDGQPLTFETTVRSLVALLDLSTNAELTTRRVDIDDHAQPSAIALSDSGEHLFITMQGNNDLIVLNPLGGEIVRAGTGLAPQGVVVDPVTSRVFTKNLMSRTVSVFDGSLVIGSGLDQLPQLTSLSTVSSEAMGLDVLRGKQIFYDASDPRMGADGYLSCAVCHLDGEHDGRTWDFTDRGEGLRNTISLRGQGGDAGAPLHWSGNFDEVQDFENDIRNAFGGAGFMDTADFLAGTRADPLGDPKAGLSAELDALAAYVSSLDDAARSPHRQPEGIWTADAQAGAVLFRTLGCDTCHGGPRFSDSPTGLRHDVGTIKPSSGQRIGGPFDGVDTPMLPGVWDTAPYLHDGSAATLRDVLTIANPSGQHGDASGLSPAELDQLIEYLLQLELQVP